MKTTVDTTPRSYKASDLKQMTIKTIVSAVTEAKKLNHRCTVHDVISDRVDPFELVTMYTSNLESTLEKTSKARKKKLVNKAKALDYKYSHDKLNSFLHFLKTKVLEDQTLPTYKFMLSGKETKIVEARVKYRKLQAECEAARLVYANEKGDFYGKKLKQKVVSEQTNS
jgi:hypothetical protein